MRVIVCSWKTSWSFVARGRNKVELKRSGQVFRTKLACLEIELILVRIIERTGDKTLITRRRLFETIRDYPQPFPHITALKKLYFSECLVNLTISNRISPQ